MNETAKSIKTVSIVLVIVSIFIIFSNTMGAVSNEILDLFGSESNTDSILDLILNNYSMFCGFMVLVGVTYLIGSLNLKKLNEWARKLIVIESIVLILLIWTLMIGFVIAMSNEENGLIFVSIAMISGLFWSTPLVLLIRFLNKEKIKVHFA